MVLRCTGWIQSVLHRLKKMGLCTLMPTIGHQPTCSSTTARTHPVLGHSGALTELVECTLAPHVHNIRNLCNTRPLDLTALPGTSIEALLRTNQVPKLPVPGALRSGGRVCVNALNEGPQSEPILQW